MKVVAVVGGALLFVAAAAVAVWALRAGPETSRGSADDANDATAADGAKERTPKPQRPRARVPVPDEIVPSGDGLWDAARLDARAGRHLEALERIVSARRTAAAPWTDEERLEEILPWEDAAIDAFAAAMATLERKTLVEWLQRLEAAVLDPARRRRLEKLRRSLAEAGKLDLATILDAATAEGRRAIERHLSRFGGAAAAPGAEGVPEKPVFEPGTVDVLLERVRARNAERPGVTPLAVDDPAAREQRRLEQLEKLRQRTAEGLLEPIAAGLAWIALHQAEDGEMSDAAATARCTVLGHSLPCTATGGAGGSHRLAGTALAVLAYLDFRDQDLAALFEPTLAKGVEWLRKQMQKDGSFRQSGYEAAIAQMALGQAARASKSAEILKDVERGLAFQASKAAPDGGYRYAFNNQASDLSVTGWFAQAYEAARDALAKVPDGHVANLEKFVRSRWSGGTGTGFSYIAGRGDSAGLAAVGMLSLLVLNPKSVENELEGWSSWLAQSGSRPAPDLYRQYYEVRTELALQGWLTDGRRRLLEELPRNMQRKDLQAAGMFASAPVETDAKGNLVATTWKNLGSVDRGGRVVAFLEGGVGDGTTIRPFRPSLLEGAVATGVPCAAAAISYSLPEDPAADVARDVVWPEDASFARHALRLLSLRRIDAVVRFGPPRTGTDRKALARALEEDARHRR